MSEPYTMLPREPKMLSAPLDRKYPYSFRNDRILVPFKCAVGFEIIGLICAQIDNTPTLAAMLRVSKGVYQEARKHLYHTVELGFYRNSDYNNNFRKVVNGFDDPEWRKAESLALIQTAFVNCKVLSVDPVVRDGDKYLRVKPSRVLFPNLRTVVFPEYTGDYPDNVTPHYFRSAHHIIFRAARTARHLVDVDRLKEYRHPDLSSWTNVRKISLYNVGPREGQCEYMRKGLGPIPHGFSNLEEIVLWPAFSGTTRDDRIEVMDSLPPPHLFDKLKRFTMVVPLGFEDEYVPVYRSQHNALPTAKRHAAELCFVAAESKVVEKVDPVTEEVCHFREWQ